MGCSGGDMAGVWLKPAFISPACCQLLKSALNSLALCTDVLSGQSEIFIWGIFVGCDLASTEFFSTPRMLRGAFATFT